MLDNTYWKKLISLTIRALQDNNESLAASVLKKGTLNIQLNTQDANINYFDIIFSLKYADYIAIENELADIESSIDEALSRFHRDEHNRISNVMIAAAVDLVIDWQAIAPETKDTVLNYIQEERQQLLDVATGKASYKEDGAESTYLERHRLICTLARKSGFEYPIRYNSLAEFWFDIKALTTYAERRAHLSEVFSPIIDEILESEDQNVSVDFSSITHRSQAIYKAIDDANVFIREGRFDSALDRVHSAIHGYVRQVLSNHRELYNESDTLPSLFSKLCALYKDNTDQPEVANLIRTTLRSASGIISSLNDLRNRHTVSHPNSQLIQYREAQLAIRLTNAVVDYIETIENS